MSDQDHYTALLPEIQAIPTEAIKTSPMPVAIYTQEAMDLYHWSLDDQQQLVAVSMDPAWLERIAQRVGALRYAEVLWQEEFQSRKEAEQAWAERSPEAYDLRDQLLRFLRFARRKDKQNSQQLSNIAEGTGHADMIQDLASLASLGQRYKEELAALKFDMGLLDRAADIASEMSDLLAQTNGDRLGGNTKKVIRDQAVTLLREAVDEVRDYGKFVFFDQPARLKGYTSQYYRRQ